MATIAESFDEHWLEDTNGCWIWQRARSGKGAKAGGGYGELCIRGKNIRAHKFAYERANGPVPNGLQIRHQCHNTLCVNPFHMLLGTGYQNAQDRIAAGGYDKKLNAETVAQIKFLFTKGWRMFQLARYYEVSQSTMQDIFHGRTWKHT